MAVAADTPTEGDYLTDGERLLYVIKQVDDPQGDFLIEDVVTLSPQLVSTADLARFRYVKKGSDG